MSQSLKYTIFFVAVFLSVGVYLFLRMIYVPLTVDELQTIHLYIQPEVFIRTTALSDANNHIINTFFSHYFYEWFGFNNISFRLTSFLSFLIYGHFLIRIGKEIKQLWVQYLYILLLLLPISFINFFALSRGYGMSIAFLTGSIYHLINLYKKNNWVDLSFFQVFTFLALLSNLSLMIPVLAISGIAFLILLKHRKNEVFKQIAISIISFTPLITGILFCLNIAFGLKAAGALYYGNLGGLWNTTIESLFFLFYEKTHVIHYWVVIASILISSLLFIGILVNKGSHFLYHLKALPIILLLFSLIGIQSLALFLGINYPEDRVGMYLYLFFALGFVFLLDETSIKPMKYIGLSIGTLFFVINVIPINLTHQSIWYLDYLPDSYYNKIKGKHKENEFPPMVAGYHMNGIRHSNKTYRMDNGKGNMLMGWHIDQVDSSGKVHQSNHPGYYADFIYAEEYSMKEIKNLFKAVDSNQVNDTKLWKRVKPATTSFLDSFNYEMKPSSPEFFEVVRKVYDSLKSDAIQVELTLNLESPAITFDAIIVADITNKKTNERISYDYYHLNFLKKTWDESDVFKKSFYIDNLPKNDPVGVFVYIWNPHGREYQVHQGKTVLNYLN